MDDKNLINFAKRIKNVRNHLGLSQKDLAEKMDVANSTLSDIEAARTKATFYFFFNISETFNVNLNYLLHGEGSMFNDDNLSGKKKTVIQDIYPDIPADKNTLEMISWLQDDFVRPSLIAHFNKLKIIHKEYFAEIIKEKEENSL